MSWFMRHPFYTLAIAIGLSILFSYSMLAFIALLSGD